MIGGVESVVAQVFAHGRGLKHLRGTGREGDQSEAHPQKILAAVTSISRARAHLRLNIAARDRRRGSLAWTNRSLGWRRTWIHVIGDSGPST
jgi:hypothetical protein